jgi:hypothetical protein
MPIMGLLENKEARWGCQGLPRENERLFAVTEIASLVQCEEEVLDLQETVISIQPKIRPI